MCVRVGANTWISPRRVHTSLQLDRLITRDPLVTDTCLGGDIHCIRVGYSSSFHRMGDIQTRPFSKNYRFVFGRSVERAISAHGRTAVLLISLSLALALRFYALLARSL